MDIYHLRQSKSTPKSISFIPEVRGGKGFSSVQQLMYPQMDPERITDFFLAMYGRNIPAWRGVCANYTGKVYGN